MKLRLHLLWLVVGAMLPILAFSIALIVLFARQERVALERGMLETSHALMVAVDRELEGAIATLQALATSGAAEEADIPQLYTHAKRLLETRPRWMTIGLVAPSGTQIFNLIAPLGTEQPFLADRPYFQQVVATRQPAISSFQIARTLKRPMIAIGVPVERGGAIRYVLLAALDLDVFDAVLNAQTRLPEGGAVGLSDRQHITIAHAPADPAAIGVLDESLAAIGERPDDSWARLSTRTGVNLYAATSRSPISGWTISLTVPVETVDGPLRQSLAIVSAGGLGLMLLGAAFATLFGMRIARPVVSLAGAAEALGRGDPLPSTLGSPVGEIRDLERSMLQASAVLEERAGDRARLERELRQRAEELEAASRAKDEFLATVSHELRSPLNAIAGWAQVIKAGGRDEETIARAVDTIERNAKLQARLIDDLLDVSRIVAGKLRFDRRPIDLGGVIGAALDVVGPAADAKEIAILTSIDAPGATPVQGDADRLQQVIWNVLANAIKFTPKGGRIAVELDRIDSHARLRVSDSGPGIAPEFLPHLFEPFRQADGASARRHKGLGLGLTIVRHLVELHGGAVEARSPGPLGGATFTITLPLMAVRLAPGQVSARDAAVLQGTPSLGGLHVLVVDDEEDARELLKTVLEQRGARVTAVSAASAARHVLQREAVDVLVSDISMPDEDGYSLIRRVRAMPGETARLPAVALTALARAEDRARALLAGFQVHVPKPVEATELIAAVANLAGLLPEVAASGRGSEDPAPPAMDI